MVVDPFAAGLFPLYPGTHDLGIRWLFDLATVILLLDCRPGDRVLDLGAGSGFSSETLARLGYSVVAVDPDYAALQNNRRRPSFDPHRIQGQIQAVRGVAEQLPFRTHSFDGAVAMNVLHHVPDLQSAASELQRVLKPGSRIAFCEPGLDHLGHPETRRAISEHGENDRPFDVLAFLALARDQGFREAMLTATLQSPLRLLRLEEIGLYLSGSHPRPWLTPAGVIDELHRRHAYGMLVNHGEKPKTSRHPGQLRATLTVTGVPRVIQRGALLSCVVEALNTGDTTWLAAQSRFGGYVTIGCKILNTDGLLVTDAAGRSFLNADIPPGNKATVAVTIRIPDALASGDYVLQFDLVNELISWFADIAPETPVRFGLRVTERASS
jgi:SAM-dependent methyltransferase